MSDGERRNEEFGGDWNSPSAQEASGMGTDLGTGGNRQVPPTQSQFPQFGTDWNRGQPQYPPYQQGAPPFPQQPQQYPGVDMGGRPQRRAIPQNVNCIVSGFSGLVFGGSVGLVWGLSSNGYQCYSAGIRGQPLLSLTAGLAARDSAVMGGFMFLFSGTKCSMVKLRGKADTLNSGIAGFTAGSAVAIPRYMKTGDFKQVLVGGLTAGLATMMLDGIFNSTR